MSVNDSTLVDLLRRRAARYPHHRLFTFISDGETREAFLTLDDLDRKARAIASWLQNAGVTDKPVLLLYPPGLEFIEAFFGCLYARAIAVPCYPPRSNSTADRFMAIAQDSEATTALTLTKTYTRFQPMLAKELVERIKWVKSDEIPPGMEGQWQHQEIDPDDVTLLQYTSGSTARPKGVMVSHRNLLYNQHMIQQSFEQTDESIIVGWLPLYHDMGLIGNVIQPLYAGARCVLMSPAALLQNPYRWLQAISRYRATTSGGPNFAYDLCVRKISSELRKTLDLSSWEVAFNGAEPVRADTLERFADAFGPSGFRKEAFRPCYGLAEATLLVSASKRSRTLIKAFRTEALARNRAVEASADDGNARRLVSCGNGPPNQQIAIVHPEHLTECSQGEIGEIWVSGPSISQGYWNCQSETEQTFQDAVLSSVAGPFLRTGDLGFFYDGELIVTGRIKDLIIIRGLKYYPQDIEITVEKCHPALRQGGGAAFSIEVEGEERLVVIHEIESHKRHDLDALMEAILLAVMAAHEIRIYAVALIKALSIPKTSSGKIQRNSCKTMFLEGSLEIIRSRVFESSDLRLRADTLTRESLLETDPTQSRDLMVNYLRRRLADALKIDAARLDISMSAADLGIDSLTAAELRDRIEADLGATVDLIDLIQNNSLAQIAERLFERAMIAAPSTRHTISLISAPSDAEAGVASPFHELSFEQERLWFLNQLRPGDSAFHITVLIKFTGNLKPSALEQALNELIRRHEILSASFDLIKDRPVQIIATSSNLFLPIIDLSGLSLIERERVIERQMIEQSILPFDLTKGMSLRAILWRLDDRDHRALFTFHHIAFDFWSAQIFFNELATIYDSLAAGRPGAIPELPVRYVDFVRWQRKRLQQGELDEHLAYWKERLAAVPGPLELPADNVQSATPNWRRAVESFELSPDIVDLLRNYGRAEGITIFMALLAGFKILLYLLTRQNDISVGTPTSGRVVPEMKGLIGLFAYPLVMRTDLSGNPTFQELTTRVRDTALSAYAHQDVPFAKVVAAANPDRNLKRSPLFQVMFNFLRASQEAKESSGLCITLADVAQPGTDFDLSLTIVDQGKNIRGALAYEPTLFRPDTIEQFIQSYCRILETGFQLPQTRISEFELSEALESKVRAGGRYEPRTVAIAATFTAEPIEPAISFWAEKFDVPLKIEFAPYNQVFQQLLDPSSLLSRNTNGINILLVRFEDWLRFEKVSVPISVEDRETLQKAAADGHPIDDATRAKIKQNATDLARALRFAAGASATPHLVYLCPASSAVRSNSGWAAFFDALEIWMAGELAHDDGIYVMKSSELAAVYQISESYDPDGDEASHIPYTIPFLTSLGTFIARNIYNFCRLPSKVIVLDCDGTLWGGVCGEDGAFGVEIDPARAALQEFMISQHDLGKLLCLCSKNHEEDVLEVFRVRTEMPMRLERLSAWRINWRSKSQNLKSLADELQLGLDSFIFIDDDPVECAEVEANCPEVTTLQLPGDPGMIPRFLNHVWAFDQLKTTEEDKLRTSLYGQHALRERFRNESVSLGEFIAGLNLQVQISEMEPSQLSRVSQLTHRTNQFNFTAIRRSEKEIQRLCQSEGFECLVVKVNDRFGDYGLVGAIFFLAQTDSIDVDTFLLSCRALGRGVEFRMIAELGRIALKRGLTDIRIRFRPTNRNQSARDFLENLGEYCGLPSTDGYYFTYPAEFAAALTYNPWMAGPTGLSEATSALPNSGSPTFAGKQPVSMRLNRITTELYQPERILDAIKAERRDKQKVIELEFVAPRTPTEERLTNIWAELLDIEQVGIHDDFFDLGGHSILVTQMISRIQNVFGVEVPVQAVFADTLTIEALAKAVDSCMLRMAGSNEAAEILNELNQLTDEEVTALLADRSKQR